LQIGAAGRGTMGISAGGSSGDKELQVNLDLRGVVELP